MFTPKEFLQLKEHQINDVTLKFATGLKKDGQFGSYFLYSVIHEGREKLLKVTDRLEKQFRKHDVKAGYIISLLKETIVPKNGEPFTVINVIECKNAPPPAEKKETLPQKVEDASQQSHSSEGFAGDTLTMYQSLLDALEITKTIGGVEWRNTDIEKIGVCLFLSRTGQLSVNQVIANGNDQKEKRVEAKPNLATANKHKQFVPVAEEVVTEKDDLPF